MSTTTPLVSIVTPVYNNAQHLQECIESVLAQTYTNWDYTIVDNCSSDGSAKIARRFAEKDPRIRVRENTRFLRALENHNAALRYISAASRYCKVVFGDDWIFPECLAKMVSLAEKYPSVGIVGAYALEGTQVRWTGLPYQSHVISGREICREHLLRDLFLFGSANSVLYRAALMVGLGLVSGIYAWVLPIVMRQKHVYMDMLSQLLPRPEAGWEKTPDRQ